jgi:cell division protein FtsL
MKRQAWWVLILTLAVMISAIAVIQIKHESRKHFVQLQALEKERDQMNIEWGQLQLEQGTWATHSRVERIARRRLNMQVPPAESIVIIKE